MQDPANEYMRKPPTNLPGQFLDTAWVPPTKPLSLKAWGRVMAEIAGVQGALMWWIGDIINYGEARYGEKYAQWLDLYEYSTVSRAAWVCREIHPDIRRSPFGDLKVPFSTHIKVAPRRFTTDRQDFWLELAQVERWSGARLEREIFHNDAFMAGEYAWIILGLPDPALTPPEVLPQGKVIHEDTIGDNGFSAAGPDETAEAVKVACPHCGGIFQLHQPQKTGEV